MGEQIILHLQMCDTLHYIIVTIPNVLIAIAYLQQC